MKCIKKAKYVLNSRMSMPRLNEDLSPFLAYFVRTGVFRVGLCRHQHTRRQQTPCLFLRTFSPTDVIKDKMSCPTPSTPVFFRGSCIRRQLLVTRLLSAAFANSSHDVRAHPPLPGRCYKRKYLTILQRHEDRLSVKKVNENNLRATWK